MCTGVLIVISVDRYKAPFVTISRCTSLTTTESETKGKYNEWHFSSVNYYNNKIQY